MSPRKKILALCYVIVSSGIVACSSPQINDSENLEGDSIRYESLIHPEAYLISKKDTAPSDSLKDLPVIIAVHGYSATPFEWEEFRHFADSMGDVQTSLVLLGGHGEDYETFKNASWRDWQKPILDEYEALIRLGYRYISFVCSSTGCPLILEALYSNRLEISNQRTAISMIDPIVFPANKFLTLVDIVGPLIGNVDAGCTDAEKPYWYCNRPQESLDQLMNLLGVTRNILEEGYALDPWIDIYVYKSIRDASADPVSALMLYQGLTTDNQQKIHVQMVDSDLHVFTRSLGREYWSAKDELLQQQTFSDLWFMSFFLML